MTGPRVHVTIGIPTFRRPDRLATLLDGLPERIAELPASAVVARVVVADNDPNGSARSEALKERGLPVVHTVVPMPGIAAVRNRILDQAEGDVLAFIDDDERPLEDWLSALVLTWTDHGRPAAVMGRVISEIVGDPDPWVLATGQFRRPRRVTGTTIPVAAAGNLLLDLAQVRASGVRFDEGIGLAGGEDTLFSRQLVAAGRTLVWCDESRAVDVVVPDRLTRDWVMRRAFSSGNSTVHAELGVMSGRTRRMIGRLRYAVGGVGRMAAGGVRHIWGRMRGDVVHDARGLRAVQRGRGMLFASVGRRHAEYARQPSASGLVLTER